MTKSAIEASPDDILQYMLQTNYPEHNMLIYPHLTVLKDIYSRYSKNQLEAGKEIVIILSTYENVDSVRRTLTDIDLNVSKFEKDDSLIILDSVKGYFGTNCDILATTEMLAKRAESERNGGCSVISDMGSFNLLRREKELLEYERSLPLIFKSMKCKGFCCYHKANFDRLSENQREQLFEHHYKTLMATETK